MFGGSNNRSIVQGARRSNNPEILRHVLTKGGLSVASIDDPTPCLFPAEINRQDILYPAGGSSLAGFSTGAVFVSVVAAASFVATVLV
ncbi:MAG: hypothetical protein ACREAY_00520 [Nitrososphaera sp.]|uniref:hypothetical protein n=1 Tax=Nitrososphaera sp. TaxID=1971748 RepID=UPI003D6FDB97